MQSGTSAVPPKQLLVYEPATYRPLLLKQHAVMREALWSVFRHKRWLSDPWATDRAENKIVQLAGACTVGLTVPITVITTDPAAVRHFHKAKSGRVITKVLSAVPVVGQVIFTNS